MTGQERADLAIAIELIHNLDQSVQAGFTAVRAEQAQQFTVLDTRLRNAETLLSVDKAVAADREAAVETNRVTRRWVAGLVITAFGASGGFLALLSFLGIIH